MGWFRKEDEEKIKYCEDTLKRVVNSSFVRAQDMTTAHDNPNYALSWRAFWVNNWLDRVEKEKEYEQIESKVILKVVQTVNQTMDEREDAARRMKQNFDDRCKFYEDLQKAQLGLQNERKKAKKK